jgi:NAD(P)H-hydrate epimerase
MCKLLTSGQMREADRRTIEELGMPGVVLMENAGAGVVEQLTARMPDVRRVLVLAGRGNNGGDGFVIARRLLFQGKQVQVILFGQGDQLHGDARIHYDVFVRLGGRVHEWVLSSSDTFPDAEETSDPLAPVRGWLAHAQVVVDAVFGTGLIKPVTGVIAQTLEAVNQSGLPVIAVDIPTGISSDTGKILGTALRARWTVTFAAEKIGHRVYPGAAWCGEVIRIPIGIPERYINIPEHRVARNVPDALCREGGHPGQQRATTFPATLPQRPPDAHKGTCGHLLILAGSTGKAGAAVLTALGALRMGSGLVTVATPRATQQQVAAQLTEAMTLPLPDNHAGTLSAGSLDTILNTGIQPAALAMGPGLGTERMVFATLHELMERIDVPTVLDADGLNVMAGQGQRLVMLMRKRSAPLILTPHPGEMARLTQRTVLEIQNDRLNSAQSMAAEWGVWVVLKGADTVIAAPDGRIWINETGNPGMAAGGSGDLLTGIIGGLLAQGCDAEQAARLGVWIHGAAGDIAAQERGMAGLLASDLLPYLQRLRNMTGVSH